MENNGLVLSGALSFFTLISVIPLTTLLITIVGWTMPIESVELLLANFETMVPVQMKAEILKNLQVISKLDLSFSFQKLIFSLLILTFLFWWGSLIFEIVEKSLSIIFHVKKERTFWQSKKVHMVQMLLLGFLFLVLSLLSLFGHFVDNWLIKVMPIIYGSFIKSLGLDVIMSILFNFIFGTALFFLTYKISTTKKLRKRSYFLGASFASVGWVVARYVFGYYITEINDFTLFFGTLATIAKLAFWVFYTTMIFLIGAELAWYREMYLRGKEL